MKTGPARAHSFAPTALWMRAWTKACSKVGAQYLPFADAASIELPLGRLLRLALFQVSVGMASVLLVGTLNRVMIVELNVPAWLVALMVALPLVFAPFRALIGFRSDTHHSALGWRRVPYIWFGSLLQFGGLAIMPFALLVLSGEGQAPVWVGQAGAALAFLLIGAGTHTTQTAGLALATDIAPEASRPRVVALLYVMLLAGMVFSGVTFGFLLAEFSELRLIQVIQGAAVVTMVLNMVALWKQEARKPSRPQAGAPRPAFRASWSKFVEQGRSQRFLWAVGFGTAAFYMQDIILEPYGGEVLKLGVGETTALTALQAAGALAAFGYAAHWLSRGTDACRLAAYGLLIGVVAFSAVIFSALFASPALFRIGTVTIGFSGGLFAVGTLTAAMALERDGNSGLALGAWGAVHATAAGIAIALGGALRDLVSSLAVSGSLGAAMLDAGAAAGYGFVYHLELGLLFVTLVVIGPLVQYERASSKPDTRSSVSFGLAEFPG